MPCGTELLLIGKISGTHGIRGQVKVLVYSGEPSSLGPVDTVVLETPDGIRDTFAVESASVHGRKVLLRLKGYTDINEVLPLVGRNLYLRRDQLPPLEEGEFYWEDLIGLRVQTGEGRFLGTLREIIATGSNDVYVVRDNGREILIPATEEVVREISLEEATMTVDLLEGMLEP